ncbi:reverse transcriptase domain-containing protein [Tanacetum coccineum]
MTLELADLSITRPKGLAEDVFVKVRKFHFPTDFVVVDFEAGPWVPLILGRSFLRTGRALIDVYGEEITLRVNDEAVTFNLDQTTRYSSTYDDMSINQIDVIDVACEEGSGIRVKRLFLPIKRRASDGLKGSDYRKLNEATRKDHFPLPFMDKMLERLAGNEFYCFLDGYSGYFQIPIDPQDQEKTTFTCPYGTFAYRRMPFGLYNAPGTFQRCMMAIFHDMIKNTMEVFMDDFLVFGDSFATCIFNLDNMLKRCEDTNLVLNWEKCHSMCKEGIVLGHKISKSWIEIARPMTHLLKKETPFVFSRDCIDSFETLKKKLTEALILVVPDWNLPFELMCDASDFAIGAVLGQRQRKHFQPIHYAMYTNHSDLKYLLSKQDAKPRLLQWVLLLQEFDIIIHDKKRSENLTADHLSRLKNPHKDVLENKDINESFPLETLRVISSGSTPWFADYANFHAGNFIVKGMSSQ